MKEKSFDVVIVGGLGHVGLPLGLVFADKGLKVCLYDISKENAGIVSKGEMSFIEYGAEPVLNKVIKNGKLNVSLESMTYQRQKMPSSQSAPL